MTTIRTQPYAQQGLMCAGARGLTGNLLMMVTCLVILQALLSVPMFPLVMQSPFLCNKAKQVSHSKFLVEISTSLR